MWLVNTEIFYKCKIHTGFQRQYEKNVKHCSNVFLHLLYAEIIIFWILDIGFHYVLL